MYAPFPLLRDSNANGLFAQAEWNFFAKLNHLVPSNTLPQPLDELEKLHPHLTDPQLEPVKVGILDRQKRFVKTWKTGSFVPPFLSSSRRTHLLSKRSLLRPDSCWKPSRIFHFRFSSKQTFRIDTFTSMYFGTHADTRT